MITDGRFVWHELRVPDLDAGARFYAELFGWSSERYSLGLRFRAGGTVIGGASAVKPGLPNHWTPCVGTSDVDAAAAHATAHGGIVTTGRPVDVEGQGRIAPILDPHMTIVGVLASTVPTAEPAAVAGRFVWHRLRTTDPVAAADFYATVCGWNPILAADKRSGVFELADGTRVAEMLGVSPGEPTGWLPFVLVERLDDALAVATGLGATVVAPATEPPSGGRFAVISDPQGATVALHQG